MMWFLPDRGRRHRLLLRYFRAVLPVYARMGEVHVCDEPLGGTAWIAPGRLPLSTRDDLAMLPIELRVFGRHPRRALGGERAMERGHPHEPHWYLDYIGVEARGRNRGAGSALLRPMLERCDAGAVPAYLNAGSPESRRLYERHGFVAFAEFRLPFGGPPLWRMWREPRA